ncbi:MAG: PfkB family carbohydrate kinase, partial [Parachlamydiaceae bacterium]
MLIYFLFLPFYLLAHSIEVLSFGGACADIIIHVPESFLADYGIEKGGSQVVNEAYFEKLRFASFLYPSEIHAGGSACNTIRGLSRLNHKTAFIGKIGNDDAGEIFTKSLKINYVNPILLMIEKPTIQVISFVTPDGERTMR